MMAFAGASEVQSADEAKEDGDVAEEITDSVKKVLRYVLEKVPLPVTKKKRKEWLDHSFEAIDEVLRIVFRATS
jgi:hypothetical protein